MKKEYRVKKNKEFQEAFKKGKSFANRQFVVYSLEKPGQEHFRIGLSISKKIGNAVTRNQIKRYVRHAFLEMENDLHNQFDYIIIARKPVADMGFHDIKKSLTHVLKLSSVFQSGKVKRNC
ncbi:ribonuclease P protein component [Bacillus sp. Bva_UNVM-123]|uniref:ribonuclease P protein component n=1 Tax=Bacillus sp. Bva_UNVM-123 TaxID=2829798 RepID=UPI00391F3442